MGKQMEGDNKHRRKAAREARRAGRQSSDFGATTGGSKQRTHLSGGGDRRERLATIQRGEAKQAGKDVPKPLRGQGRKKDPEVPPGPASA